MSALILVILAAFVISLKLLPAMSEIPQIFPDFIIENVSGSGLNKSGELTLFWVIVTGGAIMLCVLNALYRLIPHARIERIAEKYDRFAEKKHLLCLFVMLFPFSAGLLVFRQFSFPLFFGMILYIICSFLKKDCLYQVLFTYILCYYAILSVCSFGCHFSTKFQLSSSRLYLFTLIAGTLCSVVLYLSEKEKKEALYWQRLLLILQCFLPGLFFIFMIDKYLYRGSIIRVSYAPGYYVFFILLLLISLFSLLFNLFQGWKNKKADFIGAAAPMIIFAYHSFCAAPMYAQPDQHHHGEQMIPWNQIFEHGQKLYETYTPVSGLFPYLNGAIQHLLLEGTVTDYAPAISITMVIFCLLTMYLIYKHTGGIHAMLFAVLFMLPCYNRQYMVLPLLLLFSLPKLIKRPVKWFFLYILCSFLAGLYYPLFGAAVFLGAAPLAVYQIYIWISGKKTDRFYTAACCILLIAVSLTIPFLFKILKHTLTYSSQTVTADGIVLCNQTAPAEFMPYLAGYETLRQYLYLGMRFLLPAIGIWLFVYFLYLSKSKKDYQKVLLYVSGIITLAVSYSYTLVRADIGRILSRTAPVLIAVAGIYLPILLLKEKQKNRLIFACCVALPMLIYMQVSQTKNPDLWVYPDGESLLVMDDSAKLFSYYPVPETFVKSEDTGLSYRYQKLLGRGFMVSDQIHYITDYAKVIEKCESVSDHVSYMAFDGQGFYDYLGVRCYGTGYIPAARSYEAQMEIFNSDLDHLPVVFYINPMSSYYIFRKMADIGYIYDAYDKAFYPPDLYAEIYSDTIYADLDSLQLSRAKKNDYRTDAEATDFGLSAVSFAKSYESLSERLCTDQTCSLSADNLPSVFKGSRYDALYIKFSREMSADTTLQIRFSDSDNNTFPGAYISCNLNGSSLLIPIGMNACWYLSELKDFKITLQNSTESSEITYRELINKTAESPYIEDLQLIPIK